jgi:YidC/Oxa1 family membrane protein insertase
MAPMISALFNTFVYTPLYNGLVFFVDVIPGHDIGLAVIALTILVRVVLFPLAQRAIRTQRAMRAAAPDIEALKKKHADNREEQARAIFALYRERGIRPFASFGLLLLQLPILLGLYWVFAWGGFPTVEASRLYSFIEVPEKVSMLFLGLVDMGGRSLPLAVLAAVTQFFYTRLSMGPRQAAPSDGTFGGDMAKSFDLQARYALPLMVGAIGFTVVSAATLYWVASNTFMIAQELLAGRRFYDKTRS